MYMLLCCTDFRMNMGMSYPTFEYVVICCI